MRFVTSAGAQCSQLRSGSGVMVGFARNASSRSTDRIDQAAEEGNVGYMIEQLSYAGNNAKVR